MTTGFFAATKENIRLLRRTFGWLALALIGVLVGTGAAMVYLGPRTVDAYVNDHCRELVARLHYSALHRLAPGIGCTKYYGGGINVVDSRLVLSVAQRGTWHSVAEHASHNIQ